jgi:hypothetical protein
MEKDGLVRLRHIPALPVGTEVLVVAAQPLSSLEEQKRRLDALSPEEWRKPFDEFATIVAQEQAEVDIADVSDEELVALVHEAREQRM